MSQPWPIHTVVWDLDDTLYLEREFVLSGFSAAGDWLERTHGIKGLANCARGLFASGVRGRIFDEALVRLGVTDGSRLVAGLISAYRDHEPALKLPVDSAEILEWALAQFRLALVSDGYLEVQERKVSALGLHRWIPCLVLSDRWGRESWKPSERPFREVMTRLPGDVQGYVYVADNPHKDFIAPRRLGWRTIRLRRAGGEHMGYEPTEIEAAESEIDSLLSLKGVLVPWSSR